MEDNQVVLYRQTDSIEIPRRELLMVRTHRRIQLNSNPQIGIFDHVQHLEKEPCLWLFSPILTLRNPLEYTCEQEVPSLMNLLERVEKSGERELADRLRLWEESQREKEPTTHPVTKEGQAGYTRVRELYVGQEEIIEILKDWEGLETHCTWISGLNPPYLPRDLTQIWRENKSRKI